MRGRPQKLICFFFDVHFQSPLGGVKRVRVEFQNVGNFLLRKSLIAASVGVMVHKPNNFLERHRAR